MIDRVAREHDPAPLRILVLSDEPECIAFLRFWLTYAGIAVAIAEDGPDAFRKGRRFRPDLVLLDFSVLGVDAAEVVEWLRQDSELLILLLTTDDQTHDHNGHLDGDIKHFALTEIEELMVRIDTVVRQRARGHAVSPVRSDGA